MDNRHKYNVSNVGTKSVLMKHASFGKKKDRAGGMGILDWDGANASIEPGLESWIKRMRYSTWEQVLPENALEVPSKNHDENLQRWSGLAASALPSGGGFPRIHISFA